MELNAMNAVFMVMASLLAGALAAGAARFCFKTSRSMSLTMVLLPPLVCTALLTINGSLGASIAILGVFGLVRFRSMPGSATDIVCVFYAMVIGLLFSTGLWLMAAGLSVLLCIMMIVVSRVIRPSSAPVEVRISAPETMENAGVFTKILKDYGKHTQLLKVRTAAMGTMYEMTYTFCPDDRGRLLEMMDRIRGENGNMNVLCCNQKNTINH